MVDAHIEGLDFGGGFGKGGIEEETIARHEDDDFVALILESFGERARDVSKSTHFGEWGEFGGDKEDFHAD